MLVKNMFWTKASNHAKKRKLVKMEESCERQTATKEANHRFWSCLVELLEALKSDLIVVVKDRNFSLAENQGGQTTKKDR